MKGLISLDALKEYAEINDMTLTEMVHEVNNAIDGGKKNEEFKRIKAHNLAAHGK